MRIESPNWLLLSQQKSLSEIVLDLALPQFYTRQLATSAERYKAVQQDILEKKKLYNSIGYSAGSTIIKLFFVSLSTILIVGFIILVLSDIVPFFGGCLLCP